MNIKKYIPLQLKFKLNYLKSTNKNYMTKYKKSDKKIILALAANYGNLGDIAITYAQKKFLQDNFKNYKIIEIPIDETIKNIKSLKKIIGIQDIITIIGGGNFGNVYYDIELLRQLYIKQFPKNKIICFPQTMDFTNDKIGKKRLHKAQRIYGKHKNLILFAREEKSYNIMKKYFINQVYLVPDIVLSLNEQEPKENRENITITFRNDSENKFRREEKEKLILKIENKYKIKAIIKDTHIGDIKISEKDRINYLKEIWSVYKKSKIVLTDRLHGMIFCAITGTPCLAFPNSNGKVEATYEKWLKDVPYIMLAKDTTSENIYEQIEILMNNKETKVKEKNKEYNDLLNAFK